MATLIRILAIGTAALVGLGFLAFAADRSREGSNNQVEAVDGSRPKPASDTAIDQVAPPPDIERRREEAHGDLRELIDDANDVLLTPFTLVESDNVWVERMAAAALGLLAYGLLGLMLANFIPQHRPEHHDWREASA